MTSSNCPKCGHPLRLEVHDGQTSQPEKIHILPAQDADGNIVALNLSRWFNQTKDRNVNDLGIEIVEGVIPEFVPAFFEYSDGQLTKLTKGLTKNYIRFELQAHKLGYKTASQEGNRMRVLQS